MFDVSTENQQPFMESGYGANDTLSRLLGIAPRTSSGNAPGVKDSWDDSNGRLVGNTYLPKDVEYRSTDGGKGKYFDIYRDGQQLGTLSPGGSNGIFHATGIAIPTPADLAASSAGSGSAYAPGPNGEINQRIPGGSGTPGATGGYAEDNTGLPTGYLSQTFGPDQFKANLDPGYAFRTQQGSQGVLNGAAAGSGSLSGPALKALMDYNQASASQEYGNAFDRFQTQQGNIFQRLSSLADRGQASAAGVGNQGVATGANIGANIVGAGNAAAAGQIGVANAVGNTASNLGSLAYLYQQNQQRPVS
jgi:hypothetical protein